MPASRWLLTACAVAAVLAQPFPFNDPALAPADRAADLLSRLTLPERVGMLFMDAQMAFGNDSLPVGGDLPSTGVPRLGVPQFNWMGQGSVYRGASNGCTIGCCTACPPTRQTGGGACCHDGVATQLPQGTGIAATWNVELVFRAGVLVSDESLGIQNGFPGGASARLVDYRTGASSVINILRDGSHPSPYVNYQTYGECPILTGAIAVALNKGLAGYASLAAPTREFGEYFKVIPVVRHFVAYAGPDGGRFNFDAAVGEDDLRLTYLPAWRALAASGALGGVMSAISALNGIPSAAHAALLSGVLRGEWAYDGYVISDCDTIAQIATNFHYTSSVEQAAAAALRAGGDLNCGPEYAVLANASAHGLVTPADIDAAARRLLVRRVQSGDLDLPRSAAPYAHINYSVVDSPAHRALARQVVRESVVLLYNANNTLPLRIAPGAPAPRVRSLLVVGPSADDAAIQAHTYHGTPREWVTVLGGLHAVADAGVNITFVRGCSITGGDTSGFPAAVAAAAAADAIVFVGGLEAGLEEEDTDRADFKLPGVQLQLIQLLHEAARPRAAPLVVVVISGGPVSEPALTTVPHLALMWVSYFGQDGGGVADVLAGLYAPSGRLPFTIPVNTSQIGPITDYSMRGPPFGRTYRYLRTGGPTVDGFTQRDGVEVACGAAGCLTGWPTCDAAAVPGQCSWARANAVAACGAWPACGAVTCNHGRNDCQARVASDPPQPVSSFTSFVRGGDPAAPLFPFGFGLSTADVRVSALVVGAPGAAALGDVVHVNATVVNGPSGPSTDYVVALFGSFAACDGSPSPVAAAPLRTLLAFSKATVPAGATVPFALSFALTPLAVPAVERQPLPGLLRLWAGDGGGPVVSGGG